MRASHGILVGLNASGGGPLRTIYAELRCLRHSCVGEGRVSYWMETEVVLPDQHQSVDSDSEVSLCPEVSSSRVVRYMWLFLSVPPMFVLFPKHGAE